MIPWTLDPLHSTTSYLFYSHRPNCRNCNCNYRNVVPGHEKIPGHEWSSPVLFSFGRYRGSTGSLYHLLFSTVLSVTVVQNASKSNTIPQDIHKTQSNIKVENKSSLLGFFVSLLSFPSPSVSDDLIYTSDQRNKAHQSSDPSLCEAYIESPLLSSDRYQHLSTPYKTDHHVTNACDNAMGWPFAMTGLNVYVHLLKLPTTTISTLLHCKAFVQSQSFLSRRSLQEKRIPALPASWQQRG